MNFLLTSILLLSSVAYSKYGIMDMQAVILNVAEGKSARANLEKEIKAKEKEFQKEKEKLDKMNKEWKTQSTLLSDKAKMQKQQEFQQRFITLRNAEMAFQQEIKKKEQQATQKIAVKVAKIVEKIAAKENYIAVFERNSAGLLYLKDPIDLTKRVIADYGKTKVAKKSK